MDCVVRISIIIRLDRGNLQENMGCVVRNLLTARLDRCDL